MDGDLYESTIDALWALYPKLSPGGFVIIDDDSIPACAKAVHDDRDEHGITDELLAIDPPSPSGDAAEAQARNGPRIAAPVLARPGSRVGVTTARRHRLTACGPRVSTGVRFRRCSW